jgi:hypothetical protein
MNNSDNKIIYLISSPQSLDVAFLRMMQARGDFALFHEPSQCAFNLKAWPELAQIIYRADAPKTFQETQRRITEHAQTRPVFVKEMAFAVHDFFMNNHALVTRPNVYFVFLVRNPHEVIISYCSKALNIPADLSARVSCKAIYELCGLVRRCGARQPLLIFADELAQNPARVVQRFSEYCGIEYDARALHWSDLGPDFDGAVEWHEYKLPEFVQRWHGEAIKSIGFCQLQAYAVDSQGNPTFEEVPAEHRDQFVRAYQENLQYYQLLKRECG